MQSSVLAIIAGAALAIPSIAFTQETDAPLFAAEPLDSAALAQASGRQDSDWLTASSENNATVGRNQVVV